MHLFQKCQWSSISWANCNNSWHANFIQIWWNLMVKADPGLWSKEVRCNALWDNTWVSNCKMMVLMFKCYPLQVWLHWNQGLSVCEARTYSAFQLICNGNYWSLLQSIKTEGTKSWVAEILLQGFPWLLKVLKCKLIFHLENNLFCILLFICKKHTE